jgi:hypothetical protein
MKFKFRFSRFKQRKEDEEWEVAAMLDKKERNGIKHLKIRCNYSWFPTEQVLVAASLKVQAFKQNFDY